MNMTRTVTAAMIASTMLVVPAHAGWKTKVIVGIGVGVGAYMLGKSAAEASEPETYEAVDALMQDKLDYFQDEIDALNQIRDQAELVQDGASLVSGLYSQAGLELACLHHSSYTTFSASEGMAYNPAVNERYVPFLGCCNDVRGSFVSDFVTKILVPDDSMEDASGLTDAISRAPVKATVEFLLKGIEMVWGNDELSSIKDDILAAREVQNIQIRGACTPLVAAWFDDWQNGKKPPQPN